MLSQKEKLIKDGWVETTLGEVCEIRGGKRLPKGENLVTYKTNHPYIRITDLEDNQIKKHQLQFVTDEVFKSISKYIVNTGDVITSIVGSIGFVAFIDKDLNNASLTENCVRFVNLKNLDSKFLYYFLISKDGQGEITKNTVGAVQKKLPIYGVQNIQILLPPLPEQKSIAATLSSFDDKIELLREENKTLEEIGKTIFKEWFGKYSVYKPEELPEGWRVGKITEIIKRESISYKCDKKDLDPKGETPIIDQGSNGLYGYTSRNPDFIATKENPVILFTNHTCNYWFVDYPFCAIQNVLPYRGKDGYDEYFLYFITKGSITFIEYKGHWPDFEAKDFIIPPVEIAQKFSQTAKPILEKISDNNSQIQSLADSRDELLPKLMRGEVRVK